MPAFAALLGDASFRSRRFSGSRERSRAFHAQLEHGVHIMMQAQFHFLLAERADGMSQVDFPLVEGDVELMLQFVGDHAGGDGAEHLAIFTGLDLDDTDELGHAFGELAHGVEFMRFALGTALLERFDAAFVRMRQRNGEVLRKQIVAGVAGCDFDLIGFAAESDDVAGENDFGFHVTVKSLNELNE